MNHLDEIVIVIPCLNPNERLLRLLQDLRKAQFNNIVIVNDGSEENTIKFFEIAQNEYKCKILKHCTNFGKGRALKTAFNYILNKYSHCIGVITVDSDGQHCIADIVNCREALRCNQDSLIIGCRDFSKEGIPFRSRFGNNVTRKITKYLCGINVSDTQTGLRGIPNNLLKEFVKTKGERFEYEMNMLLETKEKEIPIFEFLIKTIYIENNDTSHFNVLTDSIRIYQLIFKYLISSCTTLIIDFAIFSVLINMGRSIIFSTYSSRFVASIINFTINRKIVFRNSNNLIRSILKYYILVIIMGFISTIAVTFFRNIFGLNIIVLKMLVEAILFFFNYHIQEAIIFKKLKKEV